MVRARTGYEYGRRWLVREDHCARPCLYRGWTWVRALPGGGPVPRGESSWRTVCGFMVSRGTRHVLVQFRRFSR